MAGTNRIVKNTAMLYVMSIAKMIFPLVTLPYLTRVLTVDCFGVVSYVKALMQYMQLIVDFGFIQSGTKAIVKARKSPERLEEETAAILMAKVMLSLAALIPLVLCTLFIPILRTNIPYTFLAFVPVFLSVFLFDFLFRGLEKMEVVAIRFVLMKGIATVLTFVFVHNDSDILWIPILDIVGSLVAILLVAREIGKLKIHVHLSKFRDGLARIRESAIYFTSNIATTAFMALNTLLIGIFLGSVQVAYWSVCLQLTQAVQSLYTPLTDGIYPHMVKTRDFRIIRKSLKIYMPIVSLGCVIVWFFAKDALSIVGGIEYAPAANVLKTLVPVLFFSFMSMLFGWPCLGAIGRQKETTISTVVTACVQVFGLVVLIATNSFNLITIALLRGATEALLFVIRFAYCRRFRDEFAA